MIRNGVLMETINHWPKWFKCNNAKLLFRQNGSAEFPILTRKRITETRLIFPTKRILLSDNFQMYISFYICAAKKKVPNKNHLAAACKFKGKTERKLMFTVAIACV